MPKLGSTLWNAALGRGLYDAGLPYPEIGKRVGASGSTVRAFAGKHWPPREEPTARPSRPSRPMRSRRPGMTTLPALESLRTE
jgi:hypothetical protein